MSEKLNEITEGSFLRVNEEGKAYWGQSEGGGGVYRVNLTPTDKENYFSADKTFAEIVAAYKGGMEVEAVVVESENGLEFITIYRLGAINGVENLIVFMSVGTLMDSFYVYKATMGTDGVVTFTEKKVS